MRPWSISVRRFEIKEKFTSFYRGLRLTFNKYICAFNKLISRINIYKISYSMLLKSTFLCKNMVLRRVIFSSKNSYN